MTRALSPYQVLGLAPDASPAEIRAAWRQLVKRWHPDRNGGDPRAAARFRAVQAAYEALTEGAGPKPRPRPAAARATPRARPRTGRFRPRAEMTGRDFAAILRLTPEDFTLGGPVLVTVPVWTSCGHCAPSGGAGHDGTVTCPHCAGSARQMEERQLRVKLAPGLRPGQTIRVAGGGESGARIHTPGTLWVRLDSRPDDRPKGRDGLVALDKLLARFHRDWADQRRAPWAEEGTLLQALARKAAAGQIGLHAKTAGRVAEAMSALQQGDRRPESYEGIALPARDLLAAAAAMELRPRKGLWARWAGDPWGTLLAAMDGAAPDGAPPRQTPFRAQFDTDTAPRRPGIPGGATTDAHLGGKIVDWRIGFQLIEAMRQQHGRWMDGAIKRFETALKEAIREGRLPIHALPSHKTAFDAGKIALGDLPAGMEAQALRELAWACGLASRRGKQIDRFRAALWHDLNSSPDLGDALAGGVEMFPPTGGPRPRRSQAFHRGPNPI